MRWGLTGSRTLSSFCQPLIPTLMATRQHRRERGKHTWKSFALCTHTSLADRCTAKKKKGKKKALHFYPPWSLGRSIQVETSHVICIHRCWSSLISGKNPFAFFGGMYVCVCVCVYVCVCVCVWGSDGLFCSYSITIWRQVIWLCTEQRFQDANPVIGFPMIMP